MVADTETNVAGVVLQPTSSSISHRVEELFQEYKLRRAGLREAFNESHPQLLDTASGIKENTPYDERRCIWGCGDGTWELKLCELPTYGGSIQPQPLLPYNASVRREEWISRMLDYSEAWVTAFVMEKAATLPIEESTRLIELIDELEPLKFEIKFESLAGRKIDLNQVDDLETEVEVEILKRCQGVPSDCMRKPALLPSSSGFSPSQEQNQQGAASENQQGAASENQQAAASGNKNKQQRPTQRQRSEQAKDQTCSYRPELQPEGLVDEWVQCSRCRRWFHRICAEISSTQAASETYWCRKCHITCGTGVKELTIYDDDLDLAL